MISYHVASNWLQLWNNVWFSASQVTDFEDPSALASLLSSSIQDFIPSPSIVSTSSPSCLSLPRCRNDTCWPPCPPDLELNFFSSPWVSRGLGTSHHLCPVAYVWTGWSSSWNSKAYLPWVSMNTFLFDQAIVGKEQRKQRERGGHLKSPSFADFIPHLVSPAEKPAGHTDLKTYARRPTKSQKSAPDAIWQPQASLGQGFSAKYNCDLHPIPLWVQNGFD